MDLGIIEAIQSVRTGFFDVVFNIITAMGDINFFIVVFSFLYWVYNKLFAVNFAINYSLVAVFNSLVLKNIFRRPRPLYASKKYLPYKGYPTSYSFPSGHSAGISAVTSYNVYEAKKDKKAFKILLPISIVICLLIGFSRMYLGVHYLTDVIVGFACGWGISYVIFRFLRLKNERICKWFAIATPVFIPVLIFVDSSTVSMIGSFAVAIIVGIYLENRFVKYDINKYNNKWIKLLIGYGILAVTFTGFYFIPNISKYVLAAKYLAIGFEVTLLVPFILSKLKGKDMTISKSVEDTEKLAKLIASKMKGGEVILLNGDLGCGKTAFARGFINSFGVKEAITSPTFTIVNKYTSSKGNIYHFDMYRLEDEEEALAAGLDELIDEAGAIKLIEWPEKTAGILPNDVIEINITKIDDNSRSFDIKGIDL